jgi:hypothetical protein
MASATVSTKVDNYMTGTTQFATGLTAGAVQTYAGALSLTSIINDVTTVATDGDGVVIKTAVADDRVTIYNNGANILQVYPEASDNFGDGVGASINIDPGEFGVFTAKDTTNWLSVISTPTNGVSFHTGNGTLTRAQMSNGHTNYVTTAAELESHADGITTTTAFRIVTIGAIAVSFDPIATDLIVRDGTAQADGAKITNLSTAGDEAVIQYYNATGGYASTNSWTDGGA